MMADSTSQFELIQKYQSLLNNNGLGHKLIKKVVITDPDLQGDNFGSICKYVTIELLAGQAEKNIELFVKQMPTNSTHAATLKHFDIFTRESEFFNVLLKDLQKFYAEKSGNTNPIDFFPTCFYADSNEIILENLVKTHGYYLNPKSGKLDLEHTKMTIENLALFHAVNYSMVQEVGETVALKKYAVCLKELSNHIPMLFRIFCNAKDTAIDLLNKNNTPGGNQTLKTLTNYGENLLEKLLYAVSRDSTTIFNVINHGDFWNNNMMFLKDSDTGMLKHQVFVDFQVMRYGSPNLDLTFFMFTSIKPELRQQHWKNLLSLYFKKFTSTVEFLTKSPTSSPSCTFEEFLVDFKNKSIVGFWANVFLITIVEAWQTLDPTQMEDDIMGFFNNGVIKWINENPERAKEYTMELIDFIEEYEHFLVSD